MAATILRLPGVKARVGLSKTQIYELVKRGQFPAPFKLSTRASGWDAEAVERWIKGRIATSQEAA